MNTQHNPGVLLGIEYEKIDHLVMMEYPYPVAVNYRKMLEADTWEHRTDRKLSRCLSSGFDQWL